MPARPLSALLKDALGLAREGDDRPVRAVTEDSREAGEGTLFVAIRGKRDGHDFAAEAASRGAVAVVAERPVELAVPVIVVPDARLALALLSAAIQGWPGKRLQIVGVTGTDGKTTTTWLLHHVLQAGGVAAGLLGTVGKRFGAGPLQPQPGHLTTQPAPVLHATLREMLEAGCTTAVLEVSSHSLAQQRTAGLEFAVGVFTNLSAEHLDYHGTIHEYLEAKARLTDSAGVAVINLADRAAPRLLAGARRAVTYADADLEADLRAGRVEAVPGGFLVEAELRAAGRVSFRLPLQGRYNVANALAALAAAWQLGIPPSSAAADLESFAGVPGRMQVLARAPRIIVDFAHTPVALARVLAELRASTAGELWVVLGSAGERDPGKRAPLGETAARLADRVVLTEEDSRSERLEAILAEMVAGTRLAPRGAERTLVVPDRREAIRAAIRAAAPGDTVVLAGKGPEATLERAGEVIPWDEVAVARQAISERGAAGR